MRDVYNTSCQCANLLDEIVIDNMQKRQNPSQSEDWRGLEGVQSGVRSCYGIALVHGGLFRTISVAANLDRCYERFEGELGGRSCRSD